MQRFRWQIILEILLKFPLTKIKIEWAYEKNVPYRKAIKKSENEPDKKRKTLGLSWV